MVAGANLNNRRTWSSGHGLAALHTIEAPSPGSHPHPTYYSTTPSTFRCTPYTTPDTGFIAPHIWASSANCPPNHHPDNFKIVGGLGGIIQQYNGYSAAEPFRSAVMEALEVMNDVGCKACALYALGTARILEGLLSAGYVKEDEVYKLFSKYTEKSLDPNGLVEEGVEVQRWMNGEGEDQVPTSETERITQILARSNENQVRGYQLGPRAAKAKNWAVGGQDVNLGMMADRDDGGKDGFLPAEANLTQLIKYDGGSEPPFTMIHPSQVTNAIPFQTPQPQPQPQPRMPASASMRSATSSGTNKTKNSKAGPARTTHGGYSGYKPPKYKKKNRNWVRPDEPLKRKYSKTVKYKSWI